MKEPANDCNLTYPIFNISSLNSKMTRYDPNTVPITQHWSKWPFHTEEWKKNQSSTSSLFLSFCLTVPCILKFQWLYLQPVHTSVQYTPSKMLLVKSTDPSTESNLSMPDTSNSFVHKHVVFLFVFVCFLPPTCAPSPLPLLVCCQTPSHVKSQKQRQVTKTGPDFSAHQSRRRARSHHNG